MTAPSSLAERLAREVDGEVRFDAFSRGLYSTDASIYQIEPLGVVVPRTVDAAVSALQVCAHEGVPVVPRGGGTSQCGQTVGSGVIVDTSKYLAAIADVDEGARRIRVEPGVVLDRLNRSLKSRGLFFPVDPSTASRATIGGMTANNSSGSRSIRYGNMVHNVHAIDAVLASGAALRFGPLPADLDGLPEGEYARLALAVRALGARESDEIARRFPKVMRRVGGYNLDTISPQGHNLAQLLVGSEGTLAFFTSIELMLTEIPAHSTLGVCHFPRFYDAMEATQHIVTLAPAAVELVDRTMIELSRKIPVFRSTMERFVRGEPGALLLVEFSGSDAAEQSAKLAELEALLGDLGFPGSVVPLAGQREQNEMWNVRKAGLDIMMSVKGDGKPVSIIEDCAVPLAHLAQYTERLTDIFTKYGTVGTWYAHASVGCLHVRPVLNVKDAGDVGKLRAIAQEAFALVREYGGSHSGEHGDGIVRSEFHREMFGERIVAAFEELKDLFDPAGVLNPGKIVRAPRMDDRSLFRYRPEYAARPLATTLDWSEWHGYSGAAEMCNNNGACRKDDPGVMCPSYRVTREERHATRGRANALRLALSGQLGPDALTSNEMYETLDLCVSCKACKRECPTGVDMAKMKLEFLHQYRQRHGLKLKDRLVAYLPRLAPFVGRAPSVANARDRFPALRALSERVGLSSKRTLPPWRRDAFDHRREAARRSPRSSRGPVVLLVDTFSTYFEPENARAARAVLEAGGYDVIVPVPDDGGRPLCCGRTFLSVGLVDEARYEMRRSLRALKAHVAAGTPIVGLEPSCLLTFRDEVLSLLPGNESAALAADAMLLEEFLERELREAGLELSLRPLEKKRALVHGHCHQKAFGAMGSVRAVLSLVPDLEVEIIESSCCGMAGTFGYDAEHYAVSMQMAELALLPAIRATDDRDVLLVADGVSCRHQIHDGAARTAHHVARVLEMAL